MSLYGTPNPSPTLDKNLDLASMGPGMLSSIGVGIWRKAPQTFPDSNTTLDTFQSLSILNTHHPQFCTRDVDRQFCGGGACTSQSAGTTPCGPAALICLQGASRVGERDLGLGATYFLRGFWFCLSVALCVGSLDSFVVYLLFIFLRLCSSFLS